MRVLSIDMTDS